MCTSVIQWRAMPARSWAAMARFDSRLAVRIAVSSSAVATGCASTGAARATTTHVSSRVVIRRCSRVQKCRIRVTIGCSSVPTTIAVGYTARA